MKHKEGNFKGLKDFNIYYQCWLPEKKAEGSAINRARLRRAQRALWQRGQPLRS